MGFIEGLVIGAVAGGAIMFFVIGNNKAKFVELYDKSREEIDELKAKIEELKDKSKK